MSSPKSMLLPAAVLAAACLLAACEDDPIIGPTDKEPSGGGSYGVIHFDQRSDSSRGARLEDFLKENPKRF